MCTIPVKYSIFVAVCYMRLCSRKKKVFLVTQTLVGWMVVVGGGGGGYMCIDPPNQTVEQSWTIDSKRVLCGSDESALIHTLHTYGGIMTMEGRTCHSCLKWCYILLLYFFLYSFDIIYVVLKP